MQNINLQTGSRPEGVAGGGAGGRGGGGGGGGGGAGRLRAGRRSPAGWWEGSPGPPSSATSHTRAVAGALPATIKVKTNFQRN